MNSILNAKEVAELLRCKPSTIYSWAEQEAIPCFKLNGILRFAEDEIHEWIRSYKKGARRI